MLCRGVLLGIPMWGCYYRNRPLAMVGQRPPASSGGRKSNRSFSVLLCRAVRSPVVMPAQFPAKEVSVA
eukprot:scaffold435512_cov48-Prasinocladus_malaysianus.AAC.1